jgi:hypothetical protein
MRLVLVVVVKPRGVCITCDGYKDTQEGKLKQLIKGQTNIKMLTFTASSTPLGNNFIEKEYYHPELKTVYWKWWPSFFLFTEESWSNPNEPLKGFILGGKVEYINEEPKMTEDTVDSKYSSLATDVFSWATKKMEEFVSRESIGYREYVNDVRMQMKRRGSF